MESCLEYSIARHVSKCGTLTFETKTLTALRAVAGEQCEVKEATSGCEPADGNDRGDLPGPLVIKYVSLRKVNNGPWPVVADNLWWGKSKQQNTDRLPIFGIRVWGQTKIMFKITRDFHF